MIWNGKLRHYRSEIFALTRCVVPRCMEDGGRMGWEAQIAILGKILMSHTESIYIYIYTQGLKLEITDFDTLWASGYIYIYIYVRIYTYIYIYIYIYIYVRTYVYMFLYGSSYGFSYNPAFLSLVGQLFGLELIQGRLLHTTTRWGHTRWGRQRGGALSLCDQLRT